MRTMTVGRVCAGIVCGCVLYPAPGGVAAQVTPPPAAGRGVEFTASARIRTEFWDWFTPSTSADERYAFVAPVFRGGVGMKRGGYDWQVDLVVPALLGLPDNAVAPAPQGQLGFGATYRAENGNRKVGLVAKQAFFRVKLGNRARAPSLRLGRFEFNDGQEVRPNDPTLSWLKRERIVGRLIGNFGFTHVGRSLDGAQFTRSTPNLDITVLGSRPTEGVFQLDALRELDAELAYAAVTKPLFFQSVEDGREARAEGRLFALYYHDGRDVGKTDNRPAAVRSADAEDVRIATFGVHYLHTFQAGSGKADVLLWGAGQIGDWGTQSHRAGAATVELGYRPDFLRVLKPWVRVGYFLGSGDRTPNDQSHGTFFEILPTPRPFARVPFYNLMNVKDAFAQLILSPSQRWSIRTDVHVVRLAEPNDLWYAGGGAFDEQSFGFPGRPGGAEGLARLFDLSVDYQPSPRFGVTLYVGHVRGDDVIRSVYPQGTGAMFAYLELRPQL